MNQQVEFLIPGAARSGTGYLYARCCEHPRAGMSIGKEPHFFDYNWAFGLSWYMAQFPPSGIRGEASVDYMFHSLAPYRIYQAFPDVRLVVLLRNPIDRAYSHWALFRNESKEHSSFEAAIRIEGYEISRARAWRLASYLSRGLYVDQIQRLFNLFGQDQVLIVRSEDLFCTPKETLNKIYTFVGLGAYVHTKEQLSTNTHKGCYEPMPPETRTVLAEFFRKPNELLYTLLGRDMGWEQ